MSEGLAALAAAVSPTRARPVGTPSEQFLLQIDVPPPDADADPAAAIEQAWVAPDGSPEKATVLPVTKPARTPQKALQLVLWPGVLRAT